MTVAGVEINLKDESSYIPSGASVFGGIAGNFKKGPLEPTLVTSQAQFLNWFAPDGKPKIGYPQEYQSALDYLADADALWVVRAYNEDNPPLYGGIVINTTDAEEGYTQLEEGVAAPEDYLFKDNEAFLITGANPGVWNNDVFVTYTENTTDGISGAYDLKVYKQKSSTGAYELLETHTVSRDVDGVNGYGKNIYIETVVNGNSNFIHIVDNVTVSSSAAITPAEDRINLAAGTDGDAVTTADYINAIKKLSNPSEVSLQLLMDGGIAEAEYAKALLEMAGTDRLGETFVVLSTPITAETLQNPTVNIKSYRQDVTSSYSYLGSMYSPHVKIYDRFNDRYQWVSPDGMVANKINAAIRDYGYNFPAAGYTRGTLSSALDTKVKFTSGELKDMDTMQVNPIVNDTSRGIVIMGNSTLYPTNSDLQDQNNMLTINLQIKPGLRNFLKDYLFDLNDEITRSIIVSKINLFMKDVKSQRGVSDFYVVCDSTNNSANDVASGILRIDLYVKMVKAIKFIKTNIIATAQGLDFSNFTTAS